MKKCGWILTGVILVLAGCGGKISSRPDYPQAPKGEVVEDYHGTKVADPYRWLEDAQSKETVVWTTAENQLTDEYINSLPFYKTVEESVSRLSAYSTMSVPVRRGDRVFYQKKEPGRDHPVVCLVLDRETEARVVLDRNDSGPDEAVSLYPPSFSPDGKLMAYTTQKIHEQFSRVKIRNIDEGKDYEEALERTFATELAWTPDSAGFYYSAVDKPAEGEKDGFSFKSRLYYHQVGSPQEKDIEVFSNPSLLNPIYVPRITGDRKYLVVTAAEANQSSSRVYYRPLSGQSDFITLLDRKGEEYIFLGNSGETFYFQTTVGAPNGKVISVDISKSGPESRSDVIAENTESVLYRMLYMPGVKLVHSQFVAIYEQNAHHRIRLFHLDGSFDRELELPAMGTVVGIASGGISGDPGGDDMFFFFESFIYPPTIYRYDFGAGELSIYDQPKIDFNPADYITEQIFATSRDGTPVPVFVTRKKSLALDGRNPALIYAYGGFSLSMPPTFTFHLTQIPLLAWLEKGGIYAQATLRGGSEFGEAWHRAGMLGNKQNVFDDFYAAAEHLIALKYTSAKKLAIFGQSNGGLLTATALTQRPDLYGAVISKVPVIDMLRYNLGGGGGFWVPEYGDPQNPDHFKFLYAYSPLHNVKEKTVYPPVFIQTGEGDTNVLPFHAKKFAATLQAKAAGKNPILLRVQQKAAHGGTTPHSVVVKEYSEFLSFLFRELDVRIQ